MQNPATQTFVPKIPGLGGDISGLVFVPAYLSRKGKNVIQLIGEDADEKTIAQVLFTP